MCICLIAAMSRQTRAIGRDNDLIWNVREDLERFKRFTEGNPVITGRKTWESIPSEFRPLSGRHCLVVSRDPEYESPGAHVCISMDTAIETARSFGSRKIFVAGGAEIYAAALEMADELILTLFDDPAGGDAYFPPYEHLFTTQAEEYHVLSVPGRHPGYAFTTLKRQR